MPTYVYRCKKCEKDEELFRKVDDRDQPVECPICHKTMKRTIISPQIVAHNDELTTNFGDGTGENTYTRTKYIEKCKQLDRDPVGLCFTGVKGQKI